MRSKPLVRFQLILLVAVAALVIWRGQRGPAAPGGVVVFSGMDDGRLYRSGLIVSRDVEAAVSVTVAFETDAADARLATYGWILDTETRDVVWTIRDAKLERDGVLASGVDTIRLAPGSYDVLYTTLGPTENSRHDAPFLGLSPYWTNYDANWHMSVAETGTDDDARALIAGESRGAEKRTFEGTLWATGPVGSRAFQTFLFRVERPTTVRIDAIGEMCPSGCDYGWIENARSGEKVWEMAWDNTTAAGGADSNRGFDGAIEISPGIYRAVFRSNGSHHAGSWEANPPFDPDGWGMAMYGLPAGAAAEFDPWSDAEPLIRMTEVGDDEHRMSRFRLNRSMGILIYTLGEITTRGSLYDYAWLEDESGNTIWKMSRENSLPAGGDGINRVEFAFIDAGPGAYVLHFMTDGGHSTDGWVRSKPSHPERWGTTLFSVDDLPVGEDDLVMLPSNGSGTWPGADGVPASGVEIVSMIQVGNDADLFQSFELSTETTLFVVAQGEISSGGSWDYGWIEAEGSGERVWEMNLGNTKHAGGDDRNRRFEGRVTLAAGAYTARYVSDFSHAFGDFDEDTPDHPEDWGIRVQRLPGDS